jgi:hypothetical protein
MHTVRRCSLCDVLATDNGRLMLFYFRPGDDHETELRKQREVIENLKQDRAHYCEEVEKLRLV